MCSCCPKGQSGNEGSGGVCCIECHSKAEGRDLVFSNDSAEGTKEK